MKKITLLLLMCFWCFSGFSQLSEGFEGAALPASGTWTLGSGSWAVFDNGVGLTNTWTANSGVAVPPLVYEGTRAAFMNGAQDNIGAGNTAQDWLVTPAVTVPANGQLRFFARQTISGDQGTVYQIRISTTSQTNASSFTVLQQWTEPALNSTFNVYEEKVVPLGLPAGSTVYVAFVMVVTQPGASISADRWLV
ncbi:MAG TPA: choice-of-anchor J domain-containing protein, partial [Flavobacterium sp.]|nr:choice-of-anchor J domain-containing protein [Flavobacterium sp.]